MQCPLPLHSSVHHAPSSSHLSGHRTESGVMEELPQLGAEWSRGCPRWFRFAFPIHLRSKSVSWWRAGYNVLAAPSRGWGGKQTSVGAQALSWAGEGLLCSSSIAQHAERLASRSDVNIAQHAAPTSCRNQSPAEMLVASQRSEQILLGEGTEIKDRKITHPIQKKQLCSTAELRTRHRTAHYSSRLQGKSWDDSVN